MLRVLSSRVRRNALLAFTSLVVAYVRTFLQYHRYAWESIGQFLISWFLHYIVVVLLATVSYAFIKANEHWFLEDDSQRKGLTIDEAYVYISFVVLISAVSIFLLAHWVPSDVSE